MPKLIQIIPQQFFETVRDRIADIIVDEIENQRVLTPSLGVIGYYMERSVPFNHSEMPCINVSLATGNHDGKSAISSNKIYNYNIDCYHKAKSSYEDFGDSLASVNMQRLLGMCRAILENPVYRTLGFATPSLKRVYVSAMQIADPNTMDSVSAIMGRLIFSVEVPEGMELAVPMLLAGYDTRIKMGDTDRGYYYSGNA
jgi:hypothetical protein